MRRALTASQPSGGPTAATPRLSGSRLLAARAVWLALVLPSLGLLVLGFPLYYQQLQRPCLDPTTCNLAGALTATGLQALPAFGFSVGTYAAFNTVFWALIAAIWCGTGLLLFWRRSDDGLALLAAFFLVMFVTTFPGLPASALVLAYPALAGPATLLGVLGQVSLGAFFVLFPTGRLIPRWMGAILLLLAIQAVAPLFPPTSPLNAENWPGWISGLLALTTYGATIGAQIYRYRRVATPVQRQQIKWVVGSIIAVAAGFLVLGLVFTTLLPQAQESDSPASLLTLVYPLLTLLLPVSVGIAILRYRLWDIDLIIRRTLVYSTLTALVVGFYVLVVGYLGAVFRSTGSLLISLVATGLVAVAFQPLRAALQRGVNRLLYGRRDEPYRVLAGLGRRLETTLTAETVLATIVETVQEALKLSYVAIEVPETPAPLVAASAGTSPAQPALRLPLVYQREPVGTLLIAARGRDDTLTPADLRLVEDLTPQIGVAVHTVRLTADLRALTRDLQRSREHLVTAREEERRRLRRDLHDGLGPRLSAIMLNVGLLRSLYRRDAQAADALLASLEAEIEAGIADIRRLVYNLRPAALDELGLVGGIREYVTRLDGASQEHADGLRVTVEAPATLPPLPAAVEVAAYRIVQEAVTNVIRHAHAHSCCIHVRVADALEIDVRDDGTGLGTAPQVGLGLTSMRERAEELGGVFTIQERAPYGTQVTARLPLAASAGAGQ